MSQKLELNETEASCASAGRLHREPSTFLSDDDTNTDDPSEMKSGHYGVVCRIEEHRCS
jgi:hypothetical protein